MSRVGNKPKTHTNKTPAAAPKKPAAKPKTNTNKAPATGGWKPKPGAKPTNRPLE